MIDLTKKYCFTHSDGKEVYLATLKNANGTTVSISNYGAIISSFKIKTSYGLNDIVLGFDRVEDYLSAKYLASYPYFGAAIGRYANRIANGTFYLDSRKIELSKNSGANQLHGGFQGFDRKVWTILPSEKGSFLLEYKSADGEEGYPGNLTVTIHFQLTDSDELLYEYIATTDQSTPVNLTHHSYFNLDNGSGTIGTHRVQLNADHFLEQDPSYCATGRTLTVKNTPYDFTTLKQVNSNWIPGEGYDQSFVINKNEDQHKMNDLHLAAAVLSAQSAIKLEVFTNAPIVHFYTGKYITAIEGKQGEVYQPFSGLCFETQEYPNAVNIPSFPGTILRPGETYRFKTMYRISQLPEK